ncbi:MAG TPA: threonine/serine exporter family protein [Candidatus Limnocylindria bacterium]|nr:threonine/serine exporter family protein [Candidatus Limnocylindria bacterium]
MDAMEQAALDSAALAARTILESSGETYRAEETALRMCGAFGMPDAQIIAFPTGFVLSAGAGGRQESRVFRITERVIRLDRIDQVNAVSREAARGGLTPAQALEKLAAVHGKPQSPPLLLGAAYALSAAFFAVMFGGGAGEFAVALLLGAALYAGQFVLARAGVPGQLRVFVLGFLASLLAAAALRAVSAAQEPVITGVIMPLMPGLAMTNAVRDTMRGDLVSGLARGAEALILAILLAAGVAAGLLVRGALWTA